MKINNTDTFKMVLRNGPYAWPGGYPLFFIDEDSDAHCFDCVMGDRAKHIRRLRPKSADKASLFWVLVAVEVNWENTDLRCYDCDELIDSAYGE